MSKTIIVSDIILVLRNARDKVQINNIILEQRGLVYAIVCKTGQFQGKMTDQPEIIIEKGKAKRTILQQAEQEYQSRIKKNLDKGYKRLTDLTKIKFENLTLEQIDHIVPTIKTDQSGNIKPQLVKKSEDCTLNIWDKPIYCSKKYDGVRNMFKMNDSGEIISISRGGKNYTAATTHIRNNPKLVQLFRDNPDLILDGELYNHEISLQMISGLCRLKEWEEKCEQLQFWIFDHVSDQPFSERLKMLEDLEDYFEGEEKIKVIEHILMQGWLEVKTNHDKWVAEGYEGLVGRKPDKVYSAGKRNSDVIKLKEYCEDSFEITGISEGLRREDFCFSLITKEGKGFEAKPIGSREEKEEYRKNLNDIIGRKGDVKYFIMSDDNIPLQTTFRCVRYDI